MSLYKAAMDACREGRLADGIALAEEALRASPRDAATLNLLGMALMRLGQLQSALAAFDEAIASEPNLASAHANRAGVLLDLGQYKDAVAGFDRVLALEPDAAGDRCNRAIALYAIGKLDEALEDYNRAIQIAPELIQARLGRAALLRLMGRPGDALPDIEAVLAGFPSNRHALVARAGALSDLRRYRSAADAYDDLLRHEPDHLLAYGAGLWCRMMICDWDHTADAAIEMQRRHQRGAIFSPLLIVGTIGTADAQRPMLQALADHEIRNVQAAAPRRSVRSSLVQLGYFGSDFNDHAIAHLAVELFERHDRSRFKVSAFSLAHDDGGAMRQRLIKAFDRFVDARGRSDQQIAEMIAGAGIDVLVDLGGFTEANRPAALASHPAPVQVTYLGFPGTSGSTLYDYIIADQTVIPPDERALYSEAVVYLPTTYQVNSSRPDRSTPLTRTEVGLPKEGFVFCCFNNSWKLTAPMFDIWMRLLGALDGSVLWLLDHGPEARENLRSAARVRGIEPSRIIFAPRASPADHISRQKAADLFLDTLPYNAHTTASDALWAGVPIVTCVGKSFAGRVAASLLRAVDLHDLVTTTLAEYEALALRLACDPAYLDSIKKRLVANRLRLFDVDRFRREMEEAFTTMIEILNRGTAPHSFHVGNAGNQGQRPGAGDPIIQTAK